jgi:hypothetical protein
MSQHTFSFTTVNERMYEDHLKTCEYCQKGKGSSKPTISIKSASYRKQKKLTELAAIIKGTSYPSLEPIPMFRTKGSSEVAQGRSGGCY